MVCIDKVYKDEAHIGEVHKANGSQSATIAAGVRVKGSQ
jgi:hypothetical protein